MGFPVRHTFYIDFEKLNKVQHTWIDMYLTEPRVTTAQLEVELPVLRREYSVYIRHEKVVAETVHDPRGSTFRTIMRRVREVCESGHWRATRHGFRSPGLAQVAVRLFTGT